MRYLVVSSSRPSGKLQHKVQAQSRDAAKHKVRTYLQRMGEDRALIVSCRQYETDVCRVCGGDLDLEIERDHGCCVDCAYVAAQQGGAAS